MFVGPLIWERSLTVTTYVGFVRFAHSSGCSSPGFHKSTRTSTPYGRVMSVMTLPHDSIRTVFANSGDVSRNGLVRTTYIGVFSRSMMFGLSSSRFANQSRISGFKLVALLRNWLMPDWIRIAHSEIIVSMTVTRGATNTAWENSWAVIGMNHTGQICR